MVNIFSKEILKNRNILFYFLLIISVLPMFAFRDFTLNNELRYMSIADEALSNGDIFTFTNHGLDYADKPPLYLWIVMLGKVLFGTHSMLFIGIFSFIPALVVLYTMNKWVKSILPADARLDGQLMLITSGYFIGSALVMRMDMLMCMFIVLSLYTFFRIYNGDDKPALKYLFGFYVFMAIFSKGPIGIMVPLLSTILFLIVKKDIKTIGKYWGWRTLFVLIICSGLWFTGVYIEGGNVYLNNLLFNQTVNRAVDSFHHKEPFYYYFKVIWYSLAPWSFLFIGVLIAGFITRVKNRLMETDLEKFFVVIAVSTFAVLSMVSAKIEIYLLPAFPFFAYIALLWLPKFESKKWILYLLALPALIFALALPGLYIGQQFTDFPLLKTIPIPLAAIALSSAGVLAILFLYRKNLSNAISSIAAGMLVALFLFSFALPKLNSSIGMGELCKEAKELAQYKGIGNYYFFNIKRFENTDVYLGVEPKMLLEEDLIKDSSEGDSAVASSIIRPSVLFIRKRDIGKNVALTSFIEGSDKYIVGDYYFVIL